MKTVLIYSGGLDSTVLLYRLLSAGHTVKALTVNYGQRHQKEIDSACSITSDLGIEHKVADLTAISGLLAASCLTSHDMPVPEGHYEEESMKQTVVPNRNMIMISVAAGWAITNKFDSVSYAAHGGDHAIYPDCREVFTKALDQALRLADWHKISLHYPFVGFTKADLVKMGADIDVPFERTWSCYRGEVLHCGRCGTCLERREAFNLAGVTDHTSYAPEAPSVEAMVQSEWKLPQ